MEVVRFAIGLWRWWLWPGALVLAILIYLVWVSEWKRWGRRILGYCGGAILLTGVWLAEANKALNSNWHLWVNPKGEIGLFAFDFTLPEALVNTLVRMGVGFLLVCGIVYLFLWIVRAILARVGEKAPEAYYEAYREGEEVIFEEELYQEEEISEEIPEEEAPPEEVEEPKEEELRCAYCGRKLRGDPVECPQCGADT